MNTTHTYVTAEVSKDTFKELKQILLDNNYLDNITIAKEGKIQLTFDHIAIQQKKD